MRGIETAFWGVLGKDPELKTSKTGNAFATMNVAVTVGKADDGKDVSQWVRVACFGEAAEKTAAKARKGDRVYVEGSLPLNTWETAAGETKTGLNVAAWKCEKVPGIGRNRVRQDRDEREQNSEHGQRTDHGQPKHAPRTKYEFDGGPGF
jgi:single stranded DNA-binding protein